MADHGDKGDSVRWGGGGHWEEMLSGNRHGDQTRTPRDKVTR